MTPRPWLHVVCEPSVAVEVAVVLAEPAFAGVSHQVLDVPLEPDEAHMKAALAALSAGWSAERPVLLLADRRFGALGAAVAARCPVPDTLLAVVAGADRVRAAQAQGDLLLLPSLLAQSAEELASWALDDDQLRAFGADSVHQVVWLDTGVDDAAMARLSLLGERLGRPTERWAVGLTGLRGLLAQAALSVRGERAERLAAQLGQTRERLAGQLLALDAFGRLAACTDREALLEALEEVITGVTPATGASLLPPNADAPEALRLSHAGRCVGLLRLHGVRPEELRWEHQSLLQVLDPVIALALVRLEAEADVRAAEGYGRSLLDSSEDGLLVFGEAGLVALASKRAAALLGELDPNALAGRPVELLDASPAGLLARGVRSALGGGRGQGPQDVQLRRADGDLLATVCRVIPVDARRCVVRFSDLVDQGQTVAGHLSTLRVFQLAGEGVAVLGPRGRVRMLNKAFERLTGLELSDLLGKRIVDVLPDHHALLQVAAAEVAHTGRWSGERAFARPDGAVRVFAVQAMAVRTPAGETLEHVVLLADRTEAYQQRAALEQAAHHDPVTGLLNQRRFLALAQAEPGPLSVAVYEIDGFAQLNEHLGYAAGDAMLDALAQRLSVRAAEGHLQASARLAGAEFAVCWHGHSPARAAWLAADLHAALGRPVRLGDRSHFVSVTAGLATAEGQESAEQVLRHAQVALHGRQASTPGTLGRFVPDMLTRLERRAAVEQALRVGLLAGEIEPWFQPVVRLDDGRPFAAEALARWHSPSLGWVSPGEFIPIAEQAGLIHQVTERILAGALDAVAAWRRTREGEGVRVSVNFSAADLAAPDGLVHLDAASRRSQVGPEAVVVEVTESAALGGLAAPARIRALHARGYTLAVDDFGTGHSHLAKVVQLPFGVLKLDRSLVMGLPDDRRTAAVINAAVALADELEMTCVAEGIETPAQAEALRAVGVQYGQGFLFAKAMPVDAFRRWLTSAA